MSDDIILCAGESRAHLTRMGAELRSWRCHGRELLWEPDLLVWPAVAPLLFPIVGWVRDGKICLTGHEYPMGVHGFAAHEVFDIAHQDEASTTLRLRDNSKMRAQYPFGFRLSVTYRLGRSSLSILAVVRNDGGDVMPYAFGLHPGFRWPLGDIARDRHEILFEQAEDPQVPRITSGGLFSTRKRSIPMRGRVLPLNDDVLAQEALCFLYAESRRVTFHDGASALTVETNGFRHWALWSKPPAPYLCIEAWTGHGDPEGFSGDLGQKPSMILLGPGEARTHRAIFSFSGCFSAPDVR